MGKEAVVHLIAGRLIGFLLTALVLSSGRIVFAAGEASPVQILPDAPGIALDNGNELALALPLFNDGGVAAQSVTVSTIILQDATRIEPVALPLSVGTIPATSRTVLDML